MKSLAARYPIGFGVIMMALDIFCIAGAILIITLIGHPWWTIPVFLYIPIYVILAFRKMIAILRVRVFLEFQEQLAQSMMDMEDNEGTDADNGLGMGIFIDPAQDRFNSRN